jgi:hypothetical protein
VTPGAGVMAGTKGDPITLVGAVDGTSGWCTEVVSRTGPEVGAVGPQ